MQAQQTNCEKQLPFATNNVITLGYIEEVNDKLDDEGRLRNNKYLHYKVTDEECDGMEEMCNPYEGL